MSIPSVAVPGQWYEDRRSGGVFQVVSVNEDDQSIDIQYVDGTVEESSLDEWASLELERCDQPEDWVGPFDDLESDDIGIPESTPGAHRAEGPIERALLEMEERRTPDLNDTDG